MLQMSGTKSMYPAHSGHDIISCDILVVIVHTLRAVRARLGALQMNNFCGESIYICREVTCVMLTAVSST